MDELIEFNYEEVIQKYAGQKPHYDKLKKKVLDLFNDLFDGNQIKVQNIEGRSKDIDSFKNKLQRKVGKYNDPLKEITDLCGIRIITYYLEDIDKICDIIREEFIVDNDNSFDKLETMNHNEFGYRSVHFVVQISEQRSVLSEWKGLASLKFEIQLRTVLQHAWADISHLLQYKQELDVPSTLKRRLSRLAGLIELADEEFSQIRDQQESLILKRDDVDSEINLLSLPNYLVSPTMIELARYIDELDKVTVYDESDAESVSSLISLCDILGIRSISQLDNILKERQGDLYSFLTSVLTEGEFKIWAVNMPFLIMVFLVGVYHRRVNRDLLSEFEWNSKISKFIYERAELFDL